jgi:trehalose/maltose hydrolase-like predicted phosphorylase
LNRGVARYRQLEGRPSRPGGCARGIGDDIIALKARTRQSSVEVAQAARTRVYRADGEIPAQACIRRTYQMADYIQQVLGFDLERGRPVHVEKMVALYTSRDRAITEPLDNAATSVSRYPRFDRTLVDHRRAGESLGFRLRSAEPAGHSAE